MKVVVIVSLGIIMPSSLAFLIYFAVIGWRSGAEILNVELSDSGGIRLAINSCNRDAAISEIHETDKEIRVKVTHGFTLSDVFSGEDCGTLIPYRPERSSRLPTHN